MKDIIIKTLRSIENVVRPTDEQHLREACIDNIIPQFIELLNDTNYDVKEYHRSQENSTPACHVAVTQENNHDKCSLIHFVYASFYKPSMNDKIICFLKNTILFEKVVGKTITVENENYVVNACYEIFVSAKKTAWENSKDNGKTYSKMDKLRLINGRKFTSKEIRELLCDKDLLINEKTLPNREYMCELHNFAGESSKYQFVCFEVV